MALKGLYKYIQMQNKKFNVPKGYESISVNGITCQLGFGSCGSVQLAKCLKTGETVAIKKINSKFGQQEVQFHQKLNHPNIIKLLDYHFDQKNQCSYLVLEYAENGSLFNYIKENGDDWGIKDRRIVNGIFHSVCEAVQYMHAHKIMHRDLKPENILLDRKNVVKLCDFGFAAYKDQRMTVGGTAEYMAPEILMRKPYNYKVDIWALGVLYYELIEGNTPFEGRSYDEIAENIQKPITFSNKFRPNQISLISSILKLNPSQRPEIKQIISHPSLKTSISLSAEVSRRSTADESLIQEEPKIKLMEVKELIESPLKKKKYGIQIVSIRQLSDCPEEMAQTQPSSPNNIFSSKLERTSLFMSLEKQKISLRKFNKRH